MHEAPDHASVHVHTGSVPAEFQTHVPLFEQVGLHTGATVVVQLAPVQADTQVHTEVLPAPFHTHCPLLAQVGLHAGAN